MDNILQKTLFGKGLIPTYGKLADLSSLRHKLVASNIANVNTPGYNKREIDFHGELQKAMAGPKMQGDITDAQHIPLGNSPHTPPRIKQVANAENSTEVNSVDIDQEMADLAQNQMVFDYTADMLSRKFRSLKSAIRGEAMR